MATLCWNHHAHLECYFGIPAAGGVMHPLNLRMPGSITSVTRWLSALAIPEITGRPFKKSPRFEVDWRKMFILRYFS